MIAVTNEDKILLILQQIQVDINELKQRVTSVETKLDTVDVKINSLDNTVVALDKKVNSVYDHTANLAEFRTETNVKLDVITDKLNAVEAVTKENLYDIAKLKLVK